MISERLFIALALPAPVRAALAAIATPLPGVSWTPPENLHLTLRFVGEISADQTDAMLTRLARVRVEPFILPVSGVGSFPPNRSARVLWAGVGKGHPRLFQLRQRLDDALLAAGLQLDIRNFHPHATLARCREDAGAAVAPWLRAHRDFEAPPFSVEEFTVYASVLRPEGPIYSVKQKFTLGK